MFAQLLLVISKSQIIDFDELLHVSGIAETKRGKNKRLVVFTFVLFIFLSAFITIFAITSIHITKIGVRNVKVNSSQLSKAKIQSTQLISQADSLKDVLM